MEKRMLNDIIISLIEESKQSNFRIKPSHLLVGAVGSFHVASQLAKRGVLGQDAQDAYSYIQGGLDGAERGWDFKQGAYDLQHYIKNDGNYLDRISQSAKGAIDGFKMGANAQYYIDKLPPGTTKALSTASSLIPLPIPKFSSSSE